MTSRSVTVTKRYNEPFSMRQSSSQCMQEKQATHQSAYNAETETPNRMKKLAYHFVTLCLFTKSDMPTSTSINTTFAIAGILAGPGTISNADIEWTDMGKGILVALYFTWHLTLCFNLGNQRQPQSVIEDGVNKPWRPIPAGRISPELTHKWQLVSIASLLVLCYTTLGAWQETAFYLFCTWLYNERAWGDKSWWQRALMNACGITTNRVATLRVAVTAIQANSHENFEFTNKGLGWFLMCASLVFTTIQVQDLRDQEGDKLIDRQTFPLILGDAPTRWITAVAVMIWSLLCPLYWGLGVVGCAVPIATGAIVSAHMLICRSRERDQTSFRLVAAWKRKKSGPKGPRKRTKEAILQAQRSAKHTRTNIDGNNWAQDVAQAPPSAHQNGSPNSLRSGGSQSPQGAQDMTIVNYDGRIPMSSFSYYLNIYHDCLYVVWPVIDHEVLLTRLRNPDSKIAYALAASICSATRAQLRRSNDDAGPSTYQMACEAEQSRLMLDYPKHQFIDGLLTCFFLHVFYSNTGRITKSTLLLREAIAYAHILGIHQDLFYTDLDHDTTQYHLRIAWILFITDRAHSLQHDLPPTFKLSPTLPELQPHQDAGLGSAFCSLCRLFQAFDDACPPDVRSKQVGFLGAISSQLRARHPLPLCDNEIQRADIVVTDSWLRVVLWKAAIPYVDANTDPNDQGLSVSFPTSVARDLLAKLTTLSSCALETHGPGMMSKLFEVANSVADVIICAPDLADVDSAHVGPRDILCALSSLIASLRTTANPALLALLREKMMACALDQAGPGRVLQIADVPDEDLQAEEINLVD
ncbi:UbiA prenyltransferase family-domain-containing protein [Fusarium redolens]|uniref:UbiA prenyltransferase family-domain-containing protein n=1 Tax=Fusarium redolens TaxID=48865 RepID=A0A9P9JT62_FUSRE|nr:UbiA prenyltransferase family-domain-containing protein [Fusarium redolens]KAH7236892.1 UbiA prenyltransferase family-domain-containing protein [Fusarium redolens]